MKPILVYITAKDRAQAEVIGRAIVAEKIVACVNILPQMTSVYHWEGKLCRSREAVLIAKTRDTLLPRLVKRVKALHTYSVPCIAALPIQGGNPDFLRWIGKETAPKRKRSRT
jgi:periplasmic divalent cation tolerance protein